MTAIVGQGTQPLLCDETLLRVAGLAMYCPLSMAAETIIRINHQPPTAAGHQRRLPVPEARCSLLSSRQKLGEYAWVDDQINYTL